MNIIVINANVAQPDLRTTYGIKTLNWLWGIRDWKYYFSSLQGGVKLGVEDK